MGDIRTDELFSTLRTDVGEGEVSCWMRWKARDWIVEGFAPSPFWAGEASAGSMSIPGSGSLGAFSIS